MTELERKLLEALRDCANDLEAEIKERYGDTLQYDVQRRRFERDMDPVRKARAAVALAESERGESKGIVDELISLADENLSEFMAGGCEPILIGQSDGVLRRAADRIEALERELAEAKATVEAER